MKKSFWVSALTNNIFIRTPLPRRVFRLHFQTSFGRSVVGSDLKPGAVSCTLRERSESAAGSRPELRAMCVCYGSGFDEILNRSRVNVNKMLTTQHHESFKGRLCSSYQHVSGTQEDNTLCLKTMVSKFLRFWQWKHSLLPLYTALPVSCFANTGDFHV